MKDSQRAVRQLDRLGEDGLQKIVLRKTARLVKDGLIEIGFGRNRIALPCVVGPGVPLFKFFFIVVKLVEHRGALAMIPTVGEKNSANVEEEYVEGEHRRLGEAGSQFIVHS